MEGRRGQDHQDYFDELDYADEPRFFIFVGDLPRERREEEEGQNEDSEPEGTTSICYGTFNLTMKVVPEYQKWIGEATDNWNNDKNWVRSTKDELKKGDDYSDYEDEHQGYVPMKFTKVTIPGTKANEDAKQVELYPVTENVEAKKDGGSHTIWDLSIPTDGTSINEEATSNIEYDLMVKPEVTNNAYECEPYYTNKVEQIHFEPKAEMLHAELLQYEKAWVDYKLESGKWHTLASPLQGVVAGDFYTDGSVDNGTAGIENQEYFTDIYFDKEKYTEQNKPNGYNDNSRFSPSVYQRGWDKSEDGAQMITTDNESSTRAIQGNWSAVYNNVYEKYNPGEGFSVKVLDMPTNNTGGEAIFRLPKADPSYKYYSSSTDQTGTEATAPENFHANAGILKSDDLKNEGTTNITVNLVENGDYYLIGNPFIAHLDAAKFFSTNTNLEPKYWLVNKDNQTVAVGSDNGWVTNENGSIASIAPLQSFFVQKKDNASNEVKFTADMQTLETETSESSNALILTAKTADGKMSRAAIAYDMSADKDYAADEDAELFLDSNLSDVPAIYTVAGTMATSINRTSELYNIPVGIYGHSTEMVTLSFEGLKHFSSATLYDAEKKTETPLREGTTLTVPASTSGRYFLRAGTPTGNEVLEADDIQIYTLSGNRVMVTSSTPLKDIRVYNLGGALTKHVKAGVCSFELYLANGIYVVTAENVEGETETAKVIVR